MNKGTKNQPFVSVLTPVYNGEEYLEECIQSVLAQTYENWEYVIVNNCSTDRSLEIAQKYADRDSRIRIHTNEEHLAVMKNLNHTFRQMSPDSKYCKVIHADDWLYPECLAKMVEVAEKYPGVGIVSSYRLVDRHVGQNGLPYTREYIPGKEICRRYLLHGENYFGAPSTILIRSDLIRKRSHVYDESYLQSDISACLDFLKESEFGFVHQVLSFTRRHENTVTSRIAKKYSTHTLGNLKIHLDYCPHFLTGDETKKVLSRRVEVFYIEFARNMYSRHPKEVFKRHKEDLKSVDMKVKYGKLGKHLLLELVKEPAKNFLVKMQQISRQIYNDR